ncbi:hypothetical protein [Streptomyces sp. NPDC004050]
MTDAAVLAARFDTRIAEEAQQLRGRAVAQRAAAQRHRTSVQAMQQEVALREEMRSAAPVGYAREADDRAAALRGTQRQTPPQAARTPAPVPHPRVPTGPGIGMDRGSRPPRP